MANMPLNKTNVFNADLMLVQEAVRAGVTAKRAAAHDKHWERWFDYCLEHNIDPFLKGFDDPIPVMQVFLQ